MANRPTYRGPVGLDRLRAVVPLGSPVGTSRLKEPRGLKMPATSLGAGLSPHTRPLSLNSFRSIGAGIWKRHFTDVSLEFLDLTGQLSTENLSLLLSLGLITLFFEGAGFLGMAKAGLDGVPPEDPGVISLKNYRRPEKPKTAPPPPSSEEQIRGTIARFQQQSVENVRELIALPDFFERYRTIIEQPFGPEIDRKVEAAMTFLTTKAEFVSALGRFSATNTRPGFDIHPIYILFDIIRFAGRRMDFMADKGLTETVEQMKSALQLAFSYFTMLLLGNNPYAIETAAHLDAQEIASMQAIPGIKIALLEQLVKAGNVAALDALRTYDAASFFEHIDDHTLSGAIQDIESLRKAENEGVGYSLRTMPPAEILRLFREGDSGEMVQLIELLKENPNLDLILRNLSTARFLPTSTEPDTLQLLLRLHDAGNQEAEPLLFSLDVTDLVQHIPQFEIYLPWDINDYIAKRNKINVEILVLLAEGGNERADRALRAIDLSVLPERSQIRSLVISYLSTRPAPPALPR